MNLEENAPAYALMVSNTVSLMFTKQCVSVHALRKYLDSQVVIKLYDENYHIDWQDEVEFLLELCFRAVPVKVKTVDLVYEECFLPNLPRSLSFLDPDVIEKVIVHTDHMVKGLDKAIADMNDAKAIVEFLRGTFTGTISVAKIDYSGRHDIVSIPKEKIVDLMRHV